MNPLIKAIDANLRLMELQEENKRLRGALEEAYSYISDMHDDEDERCQFYGDSADENKEGCLACRVQMLLSAALRPEQPEPQGGGEK